MLTAIYSRSIRETSFYFVGESVVPWNQNFYSFHIVEFNLPLRLNRVWEKCPQRKSKKKNEWGKHLHSFFFRFLCRLVFLNLEQKWICDALSIFLYFAFSILSVCHTYTNFTLHSVNTITLIPRICPLRNFQVLQRQASHSPHPAYFSDDKKFSVVYCSKEYEFFEHEFLDWKYFRSSKGILSSSIRTCGYAVNTCKLITGKILCVLKEKILRGILQKTRRCHIKHHFQCLPETKFFGQKWS